MHIIKDPKTHETARVSNREAASIRGAAKHVARDMWSLTVPGEPKPRLIHIIKERGEHDADTAGDFPLQTGRDLHGHDR